MTWGSRTIGDLVSLQRGHDLTDAERQDGTVPVIGSAGPNGFHNIARSLGPGVTIGRSGGSIGKVTFVKQDYWPHNTALYVVDFKGNSARVICFVLKDSLQKAQSNNAAVPGLNRNVIHTFSIIWPPTQLRDRFDELVKPVFKQRATLRAMNDKLRAARDLLLPRLMSGEVAV